MTESLRKRARRALDQLRHELLEERTEDGHWEGELSASALSTATAVSAMAACLVHGDASDRDALSPFITQGILYLQQSQNADGGFGDTDRSHSNIATSYLVWAATTLAQQCGGQALPESQVTRLRDYISRSGGLDALRKRYGKDKTFVVPILTNLAIAGLVDWDDVPALPFEAAVFPQSMYRLLRMPVVSYAIPALVAIGQTRHFKGRRAFGPLRWVRSAAVGPSMKVLQRMQPDSGGYLEATPLTAFVVMSLAVTRRQDHPVSKRGIAFLKHSMRPDGGWPIDSNLATWVTSLAVHALACDPDDDGKWCRPELIKWHLSCQHQRRHPFTGAEPGGWGWSDLSGAVPDADDTPAAILACRQFDRWADQSERQACERAVSMGLRWLRRLQNRDGGLPTFCRGWGKLPFDRSSTDLTAHAIRAMESANAANDTPRALGRAIRFLRSHQQSDGSWLPLWFGNQDRTEEDNPIYGTGKVLLAAVLVNELSECQQRAIDYLLANQNDDGGWGGGPSLADWLNQHRAGAIDERTRPSNQDCVEKPHVEESSTGDPASAIAATASSIEESAIALEALATVLLIQRESELNASAENLSSRSDPVRSEGSNESIADHVPMPRESMLRESMPRHGGEGDDLERNQGAVTGVSSANRGHTSQQAGADPVRSSFQRISDQIDNAVSAGSTATGAAGNDALARAIIRGVEFLILRVEQGQHRLAWPIGFYFAKLWYYERLYPLVFAVSALGKYLRATDDPIDPNWPR